MNTRPPSEHLNKRPLLTAIIVAIVPFFLYLFTLAPGIVYGDSPELATAAYVGGVAHPTGYPFYTILGFAFTHLIPLRNPAWRMNVLSALAAAVAIGLLFLVATRITRSRFASAGTALLMAFSLTFWSRAIVAEAYTLHIVFVAAILLCILSWDRSGNRRWLLSGAFVTGLSFTHHMQTVLLLPALAYFILTSQRKRQFARELRWCVPLFLAPLLLYLYLPLSTLWRPSWTFAYTGSWEGFKNHVTATQYRDMIGVRSAKVLWHRFEDYAGFPVHTDAAVEREIPAHLMSQFPLSLLWLAVWGVWGLWRRRRRLFGLTFIFYVAVVAWALLYDVYNVEVYYIPSHMVVAIWIGYGLRQLGTELSRIWRRLAVPTSTQKRLITAFGAIVVLLPFILIPGNWIINNKRSDRFAENLGGALLSAMKPGAIFVGSEDFWLFPAIYLQNCEGRRQDITIVPIYRFSMASDAPLIRGLSSRGIVANVPDSALRNRTWSEKRAVLAKFIQDNRVRRPVYLVGPTSEQLAASTELQAAVPGLKQVGGGSEPVYEVVEPGQSNVNLKTLRRTINDRLRL